MKEIAGWTPVHVRRILVLVLAAPARAMAPDAPVNLYFAPRLALISFLLLYSGTRGRQNRQEVQRQQQQQLLFLRTSTGGPGPGTSVRPYRRPPEAKAKRTGITGQGWAGRVYTRTRASYHTAYSTQRYSTSPGQNTDFSVSALPCPCPALPCRPYEGSRGVLTCADMDKW